MNATVIANRRERYYYVVLAIGSGAIEYEGSSLNKCALALEPGTVYGKSMSRPLARIQAAERRTDQLRRLFPEKEWTL